MPYNSFEERLAERQRRKKFAAEQMRTKASFNSQYGATTQSGAGTSAANAIAGQEGAEASEAKAYFGEMQRQAAEADKIKAEIKAEQEKEAKKARKWGIVKGLLDVGLNLATGNVGGAILGGAKQLIGGGGGGEIAVDPAAQQAFGEQIGYQAPEIQPVMAPQVMPQGTPEATPYAEIGNQMQSKFQPDYLSSMMARTRKKRIVAQPYWKW